MGIGEARVTAEANTRITCKGTAPRAAEPAAAHMETSQNCGELTCRRTPPHRPSGPSSAQSLASSSSLLSSSSLPYCSRKERLHRFITHSSHINHSVTPFLPCKCPCIITLLCLLSL